MNKHNKVKISSEHEDKFTFREKVELVFLTLVSVILGLGAVALIVALLRIALEKL